MTTTTTTTHPFPIHGNPINLLELNVDTFHHATHTQDEDDYYC